MEARLYDKRIKIYVTGSTDDGYGGTIPEEVLVGTFWADVKQNSAFRDTAVGASDIKNNWSFKIRSTPKITPENIDNLYVLYRSAKYVVNDIRYNDELFRETNISANGTSGS
jgi:SPP1 family predicted phage head-tail adaptor